MLLLTMIFIAMGIYREAIVVVDWKGIDSSFLVCNAKGVHRTA
ncbi:MAG: hypothetical protein CMIDDMOC_00911 [Sodalis sp. Fle]|nr:MAG: hypothetical protein CMIDDMOC_00911 [Sodalis sp. Fle]